MTVENVVDTYKLLCRDAEERKGDDQADEKEKREEVDDDVDEPDREPARQG